MEHFNYLAFAIPAFFVFLFLEYQVAIKRNMASVFKYESSVSNLSIGIAERLLNLFISASFYNLFSGFISTMPFSIFLTNGGYGLH